MSPCTQEKQAIIYYAVGVSTEGGHRSYRLSIAGDNLRTPKIEPADNSGYSLGTIQIDMGQHFNPPHENAPKEFVEGFQRWARQAKPDWLLKNEEKAHLIEDLGRTGREIKVQGGRDIDAVTRSRLETYLRTDTGTRWVHERDVAQVGKVLKNAIEPLEATTLYQGASEDDRVRLIAVFAKVYNQNEHLGARLIARAERGDFNSLQQVNNGIDALLRTRNGKKDYIEQGRDAALRGAEAFISLHRLDSSNSLQSTFSNVLAEPLADPTTLSGERSQHYRTIRNLFLDTSRVPKAIRQHHQEKPGAAQSHAAIDEIPLSPDHQRALQAASALPGYDPEQQRNIGTALYAQHLANNPNGRRIDATVLGEPLPDGRQFLFARHSPWGEAGPHFTTGIELGEASRIPAQQSLAAAEALHPQPLVHQPHTQQREAQAVQMHQV
ncbi:hypothetical protein [Solilutibacter oculi]|nr:hypothetical protein [Lysobacter oculi]